MNKKKDKLVPVLRFPEFRDSAEWEDAELGELFIERQETGFVGLPLLSLTDKYGIIPQEETNRKNNSSADKSKYLRIFPGDIAYNTMRMWEGRSSYVSIEGLVSPAYTVCKPKDGIDGLFFSYYFKTSPLIKQFHRYSQGLVKDTLNLKFEAFSKITIAKPLPKEQQKIADCLSTLDGLIDAENQKLDALKDHKKGLMQQLFPIEGEKIPKLRFPEFKNDKEWQIEPFKKIFKRVVTKNLENNLNVLTISAQRGLVSQLDYFNKAIAGKDLSGYYLLHNGDFAYNKSYSLGYPMGAIKLLKEYNKGVVSSLYICFRTIQKKDNSFFEYYFDAGMLNNEITKIAQEGARNHGLLNISVVDFFENISLLIPYSPKERLKIAEGFSVVDDLINAQADKIEQLKAHKRGLMQQLFPSTT